MLTFFRRIRKGLIDGGPTSAKALVGKSTRKYLFYAIGEIALVVIGILIALQINNWNEIKKEESQIKLYLSGLVEALNDDIEYLEWTQSGNIFRSECLVQLLLWSTGEYPKSVFELNAQIDSSFVDEKPGITWNVIWNGPIPSEYNREFTEECFKRTSFGNVIVINQSTLDEFKNTGLFSFISNEELKMQINNYYASMNWHFSEWSEANYREEIDE